MLPGVIHPSVDQLGLPVVQADLYDVLSNKGWVGVHGLALAFLLRAEIHRDLPDGVGAAELGFLRDQPIQRLDVNADGIRCLPARGWFEGL